MSPRPRTDRFHHALPFGAELIGARRTRFSLWAPGAAEVSLEIEGVAPIAMRREADGRHHVEADCGADAQYRYRVSKDLAVPDPASRRQLGDVHDASVVVDPAAYRWKQSDWNGRPWHETVLYELHTGALGGFAGVTAELPRLAKLGITAVELMPVNEFPGTRNWGYDGVLPYAPDASYGTPEDLKTLVDTAHGLGLMVFLDVVYNHFGPDGNYLHAYADDFFDAEKASPWGVAIDFGQRAVRDYFIENAKYWLHEYRFDGLRFDATDQIKDDSFLAEMAASIRASVEPGRHVHLVLENGDNVAHQIGYGGASKTRVPRNSSPSGKQAGARAHAARAASVTKRAPSSGPAGHLLPAGEGTEEDAVVVAANLYDAQWCDDGHHAFHVLLTGEQDGYYIDYADRPAERLARALAEGFIYQGDRSVFRKGERRGQPSAHLPPTAFVLFIQNHDQIGNRAFSERLTTLAAPAALAAAHALLLLCPQIPLLFAGEDWGSTEPFYFFTDHHGELAKAVRDGRRREFAGFGAFADEAMAARIPDPNHADTFARSIPRLDADEESHAATLERTQTLLALRHAEIVPRLAGARSLGAEAIGDAAVHARWRMGDGSTLSLLTNLGPAVVACPKQSRGRVLHESHKGAAEASAKGRLPGFATVAHLVDRPAARPAARKRAA